MSAIKIVILILCSLLLICIIFLEPLRFIDNLFYDVNFAFSPKAASDSVVVVAFDTKSLSTIGGWPWTRSKLAEVIDNINALNPKVIALDILLPKRENKKHNDNLAFALKRANNCIVPFRAVSLSENKQTDQQYIPQSVLKHRFLRLKNQDNLDNINFYQVNAFDASDTLFTQYSHYSGFLNVSTSNTSQKLREVLHVIRTGDEYLASFALSTVAAYLQLKPEEFILDGNANVWLREKRVPISTYGATAFINFRSQKNPIVTISALDILNGTVSREAIEGKIVFVGVDDPAAGADFFTTPVASQYAGVKVWATAALDILENSWVINGGNLFGVLNWLLALIIFPGLAILVFVTRKQVGVLIGIGLLILSVVLSLILFRHYNYFWNPAHHVFAWIFSLVWMAMQKEKEVLEALELEPSEELAKENLEPPSENQIISEVPQTITAIHVLNTIVPDAKITLDSAGKTVQNIPDDEPETVVLSSKSKISHSEKPKKGKVQISGNDIKEFQNLCNGKIVRVLGSGGMADVYLIWNPRMEVYRAVKVLKPEQASIYAERFVTEIRIFAKLDHPNIIKCHTEGYWHSLPYIEMEYINGASLEEFFRKFGKISPEQVAIIGILICKALNFAHNNVMTIDGKTYNGVVHRDLKPANILLSRSGRVKLTDFGIARPKAVSLHTEDTKNIVGTLPYLSPEQLDGKEIDGQTDIYALGVTLHELLTGKRAFPQKEVTALIQAKALGKIDTPLITVPGMPKKLMEIINKAIEPDKRLRYNEAINLGNDLENFIRDQINQPAYSYLLELIDGYWS